MVANLTVKYPERKRCAECRNYLTDFDAYEGLYCSWKCSPYEAPPSITEDLPRQCRKWDRQRERWSPKAVFRYKEDAEEVATKDKQVYYCNIHHAWHIGRPAQS